jgi:hypothetical protein
MALMERLENGIQGELVGAGECIIFQLKHKTTEKDADPVQISSFL